ncbi:EF-hand domain-containing protein [Caldimonas tepidiphila]|uniref:EF-hand domain-containing protein n=1 Tax=Caldimonas tepidiphila TaxID=2315841 RepID=UPI000E5C26B9|nr:EF-hand domain-containing protein [Caldimonas tepidiphila]
MTPRASSCRSVPATVPASARRWRTAGFALLALTAALAVQAQQPDSQPLPPEAGAIVRDGDASGRLPDDPTGTPLPQGGSTVERAFVRSDLDGDGRLTRQEAARLPAISTRFDALDADGNGQLDRSEFEAGASTPP